MNILAIAELVLASVSFLGFLVVLYQLQHQLAGERKTRQDAFTARELADAVKAEAMMRRMEACEKDITRAYGKIGALETVSQQTALSIARIEVEMRTMRESTQRMETMLDGHLKEGRVGRNERGT
jgi:uncharacterized protein HemX